MANILAVMVLNPVEFVYITNYITDHKHCQKQVTSLPYPGFIHCLNPEPLTDLES